MKKEFKYINLDINNLRSFDAEDIRVGAEKWCQNS